MNDEIEGRKGKVKAVGCWDGVEEGRPWKGKRKRWSAYARGVWSA